MTGRNNAIVLTRWYGKLGSIPHQKFLALLDAIGRRRRSSATSLSSAGKTMHELLQARALQISSAPWISSEGTSATQVFERRPLTEPNGHDVDAEPGFDRPSLFVVLIIPDVQ